MPTRLQKALSSYITTILLLIIYAAGLAIATFIEKYQGAATAKAVIYFSPWFFLLQLLMVANFISAVHRYGLPRKKKWGMMIIHLAFIVILLGALITHLTGQQGVMHLRQGKPGNQVVIQTPDATYNHILPFQVELVKFTLSRYPGSASPSAYESLLLIHIDGQTRNERVYMNNVLDLKGYRFFQSSFDTDEKGTILSVNRDVAGRRVTYTGYFLLLLGFISCILDPRSRFRYLAKQVSRIHKTLPMLLIAVLFSLLPISLHAQRAQPAVLDTLERYAVDASHARRFGATPMQTDRGRMIPVNTFSSEILRKIYKKTTVRGLQPDQFLLSLLALPEIWMTAPIITHKSKALAAQLGLTTPSASYSELFNSDGSYKLQAMLEAAFSKPPAQRTSLDKDLIKLDEKANILHQLFNHQMLHLFPKEDETNHTWFAPGDDLSAFQGKDSLLVSKVFPWYLEEVRASLLSGDWTATDKVLDMIHAYQSAKNKTLHVSARRIEAELTYNRLNMFRTSRMGYLIAGGILLVLAFGAMFGQNKWNGIFRALFTTIVFLTFIYHTVGMGLRWYISGHAPWSNSYETMVYVAWATVLAGIIFIRKSHLTFALATLFGGIILFVSGLNWMDPQINPLVPVLKSPWLMFHVAVIVAAYGFFGISCLLGITNQILILLVNKKHIGLPARIRELTLINEISLWIGLAFMTIGAFLGAIWANESWGRYWGWDPKETWALITIIVYAIALHSRLVKRLNNPWIFNVLSTVCFASVLMTFFGVNYLLSGMHSYGQNDSVSAVFVYLYAVAFVVCLLAALSGRKFFLNPVIFS